MKAQVTSQEQVIESLPKHLQPFAARQDYSMYTPRDHAVWRFLLHQLKQNLTHSAQDTYLEGLQKTGISPESIPRIEDINACLSKLGWRAVVVDGFLPPAIFMEFQAHRVLVIAVNMRSFEHMLYTPAPDIVHESAGHAPFLIDIDYAEFLQRFGEYGMRAIANKKDMDVYEAIRNLSITKETADASKEDIAAAQLHLDELNAIESDPSEAALLTRLHWWTVEYGLVGALNDYRIFGAGLLSSLGESVSCLDDKVVEKKPLTVNAILTEYDITAQQPQLFVTESCRHLSQILEEFGRSMAFKRGGLKALQVAEDAGTVCTIHINSGAQISGKLSKITQDAAGNVIYLNTDGPTQLAYDGIELDGQGIAQHPHGFGSPLGRLIGFERCLSSYTVDELKRHHVCLNETVELQFLSGIRVKGELKQILRKQQKNIVFSFKHCTVQEFEGNILFDPEWGDYDMIIGETVDSVCGGTADPLTYPLYESPSQLTTTTQNYSQEVIEQFSFYQKIRDLRSQDRIDTENANRIAAEILALPEPDWLLVFEAIELLKLGEAIDSPSFESLESLLHNINKKSEGDVKTLIAYALERIH